MRINFRTNIYPNGTNRIFRTKNVLNAHCKRLIRIFLKRIGKFGMRKAIKKLLFVEEDRAKSENKSRKPLLKFFLAVGCDGSGSGGNVDILPRNCFRKLRRHAENVWIGLLCHWTEESC